VTASQEGLCSMGLAS